MGRRDGPNTRAQAQRFQLATKHVFDCCRQRVTEKGIDLPGPALVGSAGDQYTGARKLEPLQTTLGVCYHGAVDVSA